MKKHDTPTIALQQPALVTINKRYPPEEYPRIYTDISLSKIDTKAGAGIHSEQFSHYSSAGSNRTSTEGEITAIATATTTPQTNDFQKVNPPCRLQICHQNCNFQQTGQTQIVKESIKVLNRQGKTTAFQWVPSHVGIHANETADLLAKKKKEPHFKTNKN